MLAANGFDIKKPQTKAFHVVDIARRDAVEAVKNPSLVFFWNADAPVCDAQNELFSLIFQGNRDGRFAFRVFHAVVHEVVEDVGEVEAVGATKSIILSQG